MKKNFREVVATIKNGEKWVVTDKGWDIQSIQMRDRMLTIERCNGCEELNIDDDIIFELERQKVSFIEAFVSYELDEEIESVVTGERFKKIKGTDSKYMEVAGRFSSLGRSFNLDEIRGLWYINK